MHLLPDGRRPEGMAKAVKEMGTAKNIFQTLPQIY
jgi:hypothetical protein